MMSRTTFLPHLLLGFHLISLSLAVLYYSIPEQRDAGYLVAHIVSDAELKENYRLPPDPSRLQLAILHGPNQQWFSVEPRTGVLRTSNRTIDRDVICSDVTSCVLSLEVAVIQPEEHFRVFTVHVTVRDINDNSPQFEQERISLSILENAQPGSVLYRLPGARDADQGLLSVQKYILITDESSSLNETFELRMTSGEDGLKLPNLVVRQSLDRETVSNYALKLVAFDGGDPPKSGSLFIDVRVADANDNSPVFGQTLYNVTVPEDLDAYVVIESVVARDEDEGPNGLISYRFGGTTKDSYSDLFGISNSTGEVYLVRKLDSFYRDEYVLTITARDNGVEPRMTSCRLIVNIQDVNGHAPTVHVNAVSANKIPEVSEGKGPNTFVAYVSVMDLDRGINGDVTCSVIGSNFTLQLMHRNMYKLLAMTSFDREASNETKVAVRCTDMGKPALTSTETIIVRVLDENDNAPQFVQRVYEASVMENSHVGSGILSVSATDMDTGLNADVVYGLSNKSRGNRYVNIDAQTGVVSLTSSFDYEEMRTYELELMVTDLGTPPLSSTTLLRINILNENDCPPVFSQSSFSFGLFENLPAPAEVGVVSASDRDVTPFNRFRFSLDPATTLVGDVAGKFSIDPQTGRISTKVELDREKSSVHYFKVISTDTQNASLFSTASVTVYVADKNDNAPYITFPSNNEATLLQVSTFTPVKHIITKIDAADLDVGVNAKLLYNVSQTSPDRKSYFDVDVLNGAIFVSESLKDLEPRIVRLMISVTDQGQPPFTVKSYLDIQLNDSEDLAKELLFLGYASDDDFFGSMDFGTHQTIIIVLGSVTATLVIFLIAAIIFLRCRKDSASMKNGGGMYENCQESVFIAPQSFLQYHRPDFDLDNEYCVGKDQADCCENAQNENACYFSREGGTLKNGTMDRGHVCGNTEAVHLNLMCDEHCNGGTLRSNLSHPMYYKDGLNSFGSPMRLHNISSAVDHAPNNLSRHIDDHDTDSLSACTTDLSNPDSGRGHSEEDDHCIPAADLRTSSSPSSFSVQRALPKSSTSLAGSQQTLSTFQPKSRYNNSSLPSQKLPTSVPRHPTLESAQNEGRKDKCNNISKQDKSLDNLKSSNVNSRDPSATKPPSVWVPRLSNHTSNPRPSPSSVKQLNNRTTVPGSVGKGPLAKRGVSNKDAYCGASLPLRKDILSVASSVDTDNVSETSSTSGSFTVELPTSRRN